MSALIYSKPNTSSMVPFMKIITSNHKTFTTPIVLCCVVLCDYKGCMLHKDMLSSVEYGGGGGGGGGRRWRKMIVLVSWVYSQTN